MVQSVHSFGNNGWQSFQIGAAVFGSLSDLKIPLKYYYSFVNGNGKNQVADSDNAKHHMFRLEYKLGKYLNLGGNVGFRVGMGNPLRRMVPICSLRKKLVQHYAWLWIQSTKEARI